MQRVAVTVETTASADDVWATLADTESWSDWGPWDRSEVEREGATSRTGVGSVRRLRVGRRVLREETTVFEPRREMRYRVVTGIPVRDYEGVVELEEVGGAVRIRWSSSFEGAPRLLGPLIRRSLQPKFADIASRLARAAEARQPT